MPNNIVATAADLLNEMQTTLISENIITPLRDGLEFEEEFTAIGTEGDYVAPSGQFGEMIQAYQASPVYKGDATFDQEKIVQFDMMTNIKITEAQLYSSWKKWKSKWHAPNDKPENWGYAAEIYNLLMIPQMKDELNKIGFNGVRASITPGVATTSIGAANGLKKFIMDAKARALNPLPVITIGALAANGSDRYDKVRAFCKGLPVLVRDLPGTLYMSVSERRKYTESRRAVYANATVLGAGEALTVDDFENVRIKGMRFMEGSSMYMFVPDAFKDRIVWLFRESNGPYPMGYWEGSEKELRYFCNNWRGYGFENIQSLYVSEHN